MNGENHYKWPENVPRSTWLQRLFFSDYLVIDPRIEKAVGVKKKLKTWPKVIALTAIIGAVYVGIDNLGKAVEKNEGAIAAVGTKVNNNYETAKTWYNDTLGKIDGINDDLRSRIDDVNNDLRNHADAKYSELDKRVKNLETYMPALQFKENLLKAKNDDTLEYVWNVFRQHATVTSDGTVYELVADKGRTLRQTAYRKLTGEDASDEDPYVIAVDNLFARAYGKKWESGKKEGKCNFRVK